MLNFRNTNIVFAFLLLVLAAIQYRYGFDLSWLIALLLVYILFLFYGSFNVRSNFFIKSFYGGNKSIKEIAITFDDGPARFTWQILDVLKEHQVPATFFCIGKQIANHKELLQRIHNEGHLIGNHSYNHGFWFDMLPYTQMESELQKTHALVQQLIGKEMAWFRPPYGVTNPNLAKAVKKKMGYNTIGWNIRSMDTVVKDSNDLLQKLKKRMRPGAVILFHDTSAATTTMLPAFLRFVKEQQYDIVRLDKLLDLQAYRATTD